MSDRGHTAIFSAGTERCELGLPLRQHRGALVPHGRDLRWTVGAGGGDGLDGRADGAGARHAWSPTTSTTARACGSPPAGRPSGSGGQPGHRAVRGRDARQRGGLHGGAGLRGTTAADAELTRLETERLRRDDPETWWPSTPTWRSSPRRFARVHSAHRQRLGCGCLVGGDRRRCRPTIVHVSRSWTGLAAATRSRRDSSTDCCRRVAANGHRLRGGPRRSRDDDARRHVDGGEGRRGQAGSRRRRARGALVGSAGSEVSRSRHHDRTAAVDQVCGDQVGPQLVGNASFGIARR